MDKETENILNKYKSKINNEIKDYSPSETFSYEYKEFKKEIMPAHLNAYEKACNISSRILKVKPDPKQAKEFEEASPIFTSWQEKDRLKSNKFYFFCQIHIKFRFNFFFYSADYLNDIRRGSIIIINYKIRMFFRNFGASRAKTLKTGGVD